MQGFDESSTWLKWLLALSLAFAGAAGKEQFVLGLVTRVAIACKVL